MSVCKDYTAEQERVELLELARKYHALRGIVAFDNSERELERTCLIWSELEPCDRDYLSVLDWADQMVSLAESEYVAYIDFMRDKAKRDNEPLKARRPAIFRLKVYMPSFRRTRTRAPRSARRASFSMAASSPGGGGDSSGESDQGDPPGPHPSRPFVTPPSCNPNRRPSRPWPGLGSFRMERGRSAW